MTEPNLRAIFAGDQASTDAKVLADALVVYYQTLVRGGFVPRRAYDLAQAYQARQLGQDGAGPSLVAALLEGMDE